MGKYYIKSGTLEVTLSKNDALEAAISGLLLTNKFDTIDEYFYVDERGYRDYISADKDTSVIATKSIVRAAGWELSRGDDEQKKAAGRLDVTPYASSTQEKSEKSFMLVVDSADNYAILIASHDKTLTNRNAKKVRSSP